MKIILGQQVQCGDHIVHEGKRVQVLQCGFGTGAFDFEFGEYVWVKAKSPYSENKIYFWIFRNSPIVKLVDPFENGEPMW